METKKALTKTLFRPKVQYKLLDNNDQPKHTFMPCERLQLLCYRRLCRIINAATTTKENKISVLETLDVINNHKKDCKCGRSTLMHEIFTTLESSTDVMFDTHEGLRKLLEYEI